MNTLQAQPITLTILGSGNVATHLGLAFQKAGHQVQAVYSRQLSHALTLARQLGAAHATDNLNFRALPPSNIYLIAVSDAAVTEVVEQAQFPEGSLLVHTSGSLPLTVLPEKYRTGVFYPIQTFSKNQPVNLLETPIALEASGADGLELLQQLARSISQQVVTLSSQERQKLHLAAVFACNFTNHLLGISREILTQNQLPPDLLHLLIQATLQKALANNPFAVQTGPAIRGDINILASQEKQLQDQPVYQKIYRLLSQSIREKAVEANQK